MKGAFIKIGNSQGVRIPKVLLQESGLSGQLELRAEAGRIVIERAKHPREGWEEAAWQVSQDGGDELHLGDFPNEFDKEDWTW